MRNSLWLGTAVALVLGTSSIAYAQQGQPQQGQGQQMQQSGQQVQQQAKKLQEARTSIEEAQASDLQQPVTEAKATLSQIRQAILDSQMEKQQVTQLTQQIDQTEEALEKALASKDKQAAVKAITDLESQMKEMQTAQASGGQQQSSSQQQMAQAGGGAEGADIRVQQPAPDVTVQQPAPDVTVQQPAPDVTVIQPEPEVSVSQAEPEVSVETAEPQVNVQQQGETDVRVVQEDEAEISMRRETEQTEGLIGEEEEGILEGTTERAETAVGAAGLETEREVEVEQETAAVDRTAITTDREQMTTGGMDVTQAENLIGESIVGPTGDEIGDIGDLLIDRESGEIQGMIVEVGGFLGLGERQVMIPWQEATYNPAEGTVLVNMTKDQLEALPEFEYGAIEEGMVGMRQR